jgi:[ribosomal protein S18]-alanine N-acetyltransferase
MSVDLLLPQGFELPTGYFALAAFTEADLADIFAIEQRSHLHPWRLENLRSSLASHTCIGLKHQGQWVAYGVVSFVVGEAELLLFVVDKAWQGRGLGNRFLKELLAAAAQKAGTMFLEVRASNRRAVDLYENLGFNQVGTRPGYYPLPKGAREDALLYALALTDNFLPFPV